MEAGPLLTSERLHRLERQSDAASRAAKTTHSRHTRRPWQRCSRASLKRRNISTSSESFASGCRTRLPHSTSSRSAKGTLLHQEPSTSPKRRASVGGGFYFERWTQVDVWFSSKLELRAQDRGKAVKNLDRMLYHEAKVGSSSRTQRTKRRCCEHSLNTQEQDDWMLPSTYATRRIKAGEPQHCVARCYIMTRLLASKCKTSIAS